VEDRSRRSDVLIRIALVAGLLLAALIIIADMLSSV